MYDHLQVSKLEKSLKQAQATVALQTKEMTVLGRAQALTDWTSFAAIRKRLLSSMVSLHLLDHACHCRDCTEMCL